MLFSLYDFVFFSFSLWLISGFIPLWSEKMLDMISVFLSLLRLVLCLNTWPILENVPCAVEKNVYSAALGWNVLKISIKSICSSVSFQVTVSLLIVCLKDLSIAVNGVLKSPTTTILLSTSPFKHIKICFTYLGAFMLGAYVSQSYSLLLDCSFYHYVLSFFISYCSLTANQLSAVILGLDEWMGSASVWITSAVLLLIKLGPLRCLLAYISRFPLWKTSKLT